MYQRVQHALSLPVISAAVSWLFLCCPVSVVAEDVPLASQSTTPQASQEVAPSNDSSPLTAAQQEAKELATVLSEEEESPVASPPPTPLALLAEQPLRPGERVAILLFSWLGFDLYLVSGQQTLASPVDGASIVQTAAATSAFIQPLDVGPEDTTIAVEVRVK